MQTAENRAVGRGSGKTKNYGNGKEMERKWKWKWKRKWLMQTHSALLLTMP